MSNLLFKILTPAEWNSFKDERVFDGSVLDQQDGFLHLSFSHQWEKTWQKFFNSGECYLLEINTAKLNPKLLKIEANRPGGEQYPHYYGKLLIESVSKSTTLP